MKKVAKIGILLVLFAFLYNLITVFAEDGYWVEPGRSEAKGKIYTTFGDWEFFYHEDFEQTIVRDSPQTFMRDNGVNFNIEGEVIDNNNINTILNKSVLLKPGDGFGAQRRLIIQFPRGLGGFSFNYKNLKDNNEEPILEIKVYNDSLEKEPVYQKSLTSENEIGFQRYDFNIRPTGEENLVTVIMETTAGSQAVIDNIKWSDYDIKVDFKDGYNENKLFTTKYVRYGRKVNSYITEVENSIFLEGYENFNWYTHPSLEKEYLFIEDTPIKEDLTLYLDRDLITYEIEYELNEGYFKPFVNRDEMIVAFLTDLYNYLDENGKLQNTDFHQVLADQDLANITEITLDDFIYGTGYSKENPKEGNYGGIYDGLFAKGFVISDFKDDEGNYTITYETDGGIFGNIGGSNYTNRTVMLSDFLKDFHTYLTENHGYSKSLDTFMHGSGKTSGFDGEYNNRVYFDRLFTPNNKSVNSSLNTFINQPEYNKWVPLLDLMDEYTNTGNPSQYYWNNLYVASLRTKSFIQNKNPWYGEGEPKRTQINNILKKIPTNIYTGGTSQDIPIIFNGEVDVSLPKPTKLGSTFNGWYTYNYEEETFSGPITKISKGTSTSVILYAKWDSKTPTPIAYENIPKMLHKESYFSQIYKMDENWDVDEFDLTLRLSNLERQKLGLEELDYFINQPEYNKWVPLIDLIHEYTIYGNPDQKWHGIWKSYYTGAIRMEMFFQQYNPWVGSQRSELQYTVFEMLRRVPHTIPKDNIPYTYTVESEDIVLPKPEKAHANLTGWYTDPNFISNSKIEVIKKGSTKNIKVYAYYDERKYEITYDLDGGSFAPYTNRDEMINDFLDDFYYFVKEKLNHNFDVSLTKFKHGNTASGFNGTYTDYIYFSDEIKLVPVQLLFATGNNTIDPQTNMFINQEDYNKRWLPLLTMASDFTKAVNSSDDFWNDPKLAADRLKQLFMKVRPSGSNNIDHFFSKIPSDIPKDKVPYYYLNTEETTLPTPIKENYRFIGWKDETTGQIWEGNIPLNTSGNLTFKASWIPEGSYQVIYDFGEFGYHTITKTELFSLFINDYIKEFNFPDTYTETKFFLDFFNSSKKEYSKKDFQNIFTLYSNRWAWLKDYITAIATKDNYQYLTELNEFDEVIWRLNIDAFFNGIQKTVEVDENTYSSLDFKPLENANSFWQTTSYNTYTKELIPGEEVFEEAFINSWHPGYEFSGWYLDADFSGSPLTNLPSEPNSDITIYAKWNKLDGIVVTFVDYNDNVIAVISFDFNDEITAPEDPSREHYDFAGWDKNLNDITESTVVKALYNPHTYILQFNVDGGTPIVNQELVYPNTPTKPTNPTKEGFSFAGWYSDIELTIPFNFAFPLYGSNNNDIITIYAKWNPTTYNITYILNGGQNHDANPETYTNLDVITLLAATKENHSFLGWYLAENFTEENKIETISNKIGDLTLYANFELYKYKVTFNTNGGTIIEPQEVAYGSKVEKPNDPVKEGFVFEYWSVNGNEFDFQTEIKEDIILYANYKDASYSVKFYGEDNKLIEEFNPKHGEYINIIDVPNKIDDLGNEVEGYNKKWNIDLSNIPIEKNYEIYPLYTAIEYTITYILEGGVNSELNPESYTVLTELVTLFSATKEGYEFIGWYNKEVEGEKRESIPKGSFGDIILYARFSVKTYTITYNLDGGVNSELNPESYTINDLIILQPATKEGYEFIGWYLDENFTEENKIETISNKTGNLILYAKYSEPVYFDIHYVLYVSGVEPNDKAEFSPTTTTYNTVEGATLSIPSDRTSSVFSGWYNNPEFSGEVVTEIEPNSFGHKTFYAKWTLKLYNIEIYNSKEDLDTGSPTKTINDIPHSSIINLSDFEGEIEEGYEFIGWYYVENNTEILFEEDMQINKNFQVFPKFSLKLYTVTFYNRTILLATRYVYYNNTIPNMPTNPTGEFLGWFLENGTIFNEQTKVTSDLVVIAKFNEEDANYHTVVFEYVNEEETIQKVLEVNEGHKLNITDIPNIPSRVGYTFVDWKTNGDSYTNETLINLEINKNYVFTANYSINTYEVKFYNEETLLKTIIVTHGSNAVYDGLMPTKENYTFTGWDKPLTNITEPTIFKATFELNKYFVMFYSDQELLETITVTHGSDATSTITPQKEHYKHVGWDQDLTNITENIITYALFSGNTYTITYISNELEIDTVEVIYPNRTTKPNNPNRDGYVFVGWYSDEQFIEEFTFNDVLTSNITLYANWEEKNLIVRFISDDVLYKEESIAYNKEVSKPTDPEKTGHIFNGWYLNDDLFEFTTPIVSDITLTAKWNKQTFTVIYNDDDNTQLHTFNVLYGETITVPPLPTPEDGYTVSWSLNLNNFIITENITVTLVSTPIVYTITYNGLFNGVTHSNPLTYKITDDNINLVAPTNIPAGNLFVGWYNNSLFEGSEVTTINKGSFLDIHLYAKWDLTTYTINYELDGGSFVGYSSRKLMIEDFLTEFWTYLGKPGTLNDFIHGVGKTSGFDGLYNNEEYFIKLYEPGDKRIDPSIEKFINQPEYNKWVLLLDVMEEYTNLGKDENGFIQSFWESQYIGQRRIKPFIMETRPATGTWTDKTDEEIKAITGKIPEGLASEKVYYEYDLNTPTITLLTPVKENYTFLGWYTEKTGGTKVANLPKGSTGDKTFYARWSIPTYTITYELDGGIFDAYQTKEDLIDGFLQDLYDFVGATESYQEFKGGIWYSKALYKDKIYNGSKPTKDDNNYFISAAKYRLKWAPFFEMMDIFVKKGNEEQSFFGGTFVGLMRLDQYIRGVKPGSAWTDEDMRLMPSDSVKITAPTTYNRGNREIILPIPTRDDHSFNGWYTAKTGGTKVTSIKANSTGNKTFYARWTPLVTFSDFERKIMTQSLAYYNNVNNPEVYKRKTTTGVIILSSTMPGVNADGWFTRWNNMSSYEASHAVVDNNKSIQLLEWDFRGFHTANQGNYTYVAIMIAENSGYSYNGSVIQGYNKQNQKTYFDAAWERAVALTVFVLRYYNITTVNQTTVIGRHDAYDLGLALTPKANPGVLFAANDKTMAEFRADVRARL